MTWTRRLSPQSGFTLLELLVAIMILTMIMTAAMGAVRVASRSFEAGIQRSDENARIRVVADILRRQFRQLLPVTWNENRRDFIAFKGDRDRVQFVAPAPDSSTGPGYLIYQISNVPSQEQNPLVLEFAAFDPGSDGFDMPANSGREVLANDIQVSFDYFGALDELDSPDWHENWLPGSARLPTVVRMHLASSGQQWPELLFRVRFKGSR
jgi:prepilin-type N-terminal cleavage/methylation domain-containing protein